MKRRSEGEVLQSLFAKYDKDLALDYLPFDTLTPEQQSNWQRIAREFQREMENHR